ncbi:HIRAN domain-containing protein [Brevibacterium sp. CT2-23B]|uniref:HIRAN domain-containing protein n=1 Tax=Brevibacterium sp. CT2-23B TaxID=2729630 RepID=UPI0034649CC2
MFPTQVETSANPTSASGAIARKLLVTQKLPPRNLYTELGFLEQRGDSAYRFEYLASYVNGQHFRELPGLPLKRGGIDSSRLFPFFAERVISAGRPDRSQSLMYLDLESSARPYEILARSGGIRKNDTIELLPLPSVDPQGNHSLTFFVHGVRHLEDRNSYAVLDSLTPGDRLEIEREPMNMESELALRVESQDAKLGYVPHPLIEYIGSAVRKNKYSLTVVQRNSAEAGFHQRLLVEFRCPGSSSAGDFAGSRWETW